MKKTVVHFEIGCQDIPGTSQFYQQVFGWEINPTGNSASIDTGDPSSLTGHLNKLGPNDPQNYVTVYIETDTLEADLAAIESHGGKRFVGPLNLADGRQFAWFEDVAGNKLGLISPGSE